MSNQSFSDLPSQQRRERIAAVLAMGLARVLDRRSRISANSHDPSLELLSGIRLSVSQPDFGDPVVTDGLQVRSNEQLGWK